VLLLLLLLQIWCVPVPKPGSHVPAVCKPDTIRQQLQIVLVLQRVASDCGMQSILPRHWVAPVDGVLPHSGFRVSWDALWADLVVGVSAENFVHGGKPAVNSELLLEFMHSKLDSSQVREFHKLQEHNVICEWCLGFCLV
jgi:hypothetical protein